MEDSSEPCQANDDMIPILDNSNSISNDFYTYLSSIPKQRGFKMAFINIVSLPKKIDEIRYSMSSKNIDLIAFNDSSIGDSILNLNDYDLIRRDRSRNRGGKCIYLRPCVAP